MEIVSQKNFGTVHLVQKKKERENLENLIENSFGSITCLLLIYLFIYLFVLLLTDFSYAVGINKFTVFVYKGNFWQDWLKQLLLMLVETIETLHNTDLFKNNQKWSKNSDINYIEKK